MRTVNLLTVVAFSSSLVYCLPQGIGEPGRSTVLTFPGFSFTIPVDSTSTQDRVTVIDPGTVRTTTSSTIKTLSPMTSESTTSSTIKTLPPTTSSTTSSSITKTLPPTTEPTAPITTPPTSVPTAAPTSTPPTTSSTIKSLPLTTTSNIKTLPPTTAPSATPTNPWAANCPVPSSYTINNFVSISGEGTGTGVSLSVTYGNGTFRCQNRPESQEVYDGIYDTLCSEDGISRVITDGATWVSVQEWFWCPSVPQPHNSFSTLETSANFTNLASNLICNTDDIGVRTCFQDTPSIAIPVQSYGTGGIIGFAPIDVNGTPLPQCPSVAFTNPIVTNTATCTGTNASPSSTITAPPSSSTTGKSTIVVSNTQSATVTVVQPPPPRR